MEHAIVGYVIFLAIFYALLAITKKGKWIGGIFGVRFEKYDKLIDFVKKHEKAINIFSKISCFSMIIIILYSFYIISRYFVHVLVTPEKTPGVSLIIPGMTIPGTKVKVPLIEGIIAIFLTAFFHELSHAIVAIKRGVKVNGIGFGFFLIFPIAFVDIDEEDLKRKIDDLPYIASAGPFSNMVVAVISFLILILIVHLIKIGTVEVGVKIVESQNPGLNAGEIIQEINGTRIKNIIDLKEYLLKVKPGSILLVKTDKGERIVKTTNKSGISYIGITVKNEIKPKNTIFGRLLGLFSFMANLFYWIYFINYAVGLFNAYPIPFLDGSLFLASFLRKYISNEKIYNYVISTIILISVSILIGVIVIPIIR